MSEEQVKVTIDGKVIDAPKGALLIDVADKVGIPIPRFCYHKKLSIAANCRMCLVDVEKVPKPLPACATPVMEGMVVHTRSTRAIEAQKSTMEFLLINHPLDCPICDQGGECELQDVSYLYGGDVSQYADSKRVVLDKNIGPLISTEFTRCIQCTRCVRFGDEIAGMRELGATGRGDTMNIGTYIEKTIDSELSGNVIDICPVGALTAKPSRYQARAWELSSYPSVAMHDCVGSNIDVHVFEGKINRVVPRENEAINESWISDRDRFSYQGVNAQDRDTSPQVNRNGKWVEVSWQEALEEAANQIELMIEKYGNEKVGGLVSANSSLEELYLFQKIFSQKGLDNIDHRLMQSDFRQQENAPVMPWLGMDIVDLESLDGALLVASNLQKEQPMLNHRLRKAAKQGAIVNSLTLQRYEGNISIDNNIVSSPADLISNLASVYIAACDIAKTEANKDIVALLGDSKPSPASKRIARSLIKGSKTALILGSQVATLVDSSIIQKLSIEICKVADCTLSMLSEGANTAAAWLTGCVPHRGPAGASCDKQGFDARAMISQGLKAYIMMNVEPDYDTQNAQQTMQSLDEAESVVFISAFLNEEMKKVGTVFLPAVTSFENSGTQINCEGRWQSFSAAIEPVGDSRPAWKVLRVLGNMFELDGFDYHSVNEVKKEVQQLCSDLELNNQTDMELEGSTEQSGLIRVGDRSLYSVDSMVRRAQALQQTRDSIESNTVKISSKAAKKAGFVGNHKVNLIQGDISVVTEISIDDSIPNDCLWVPLSSYVSSKLAGNNDQISVEAI